jgi:mono/diheme cytochrome c family protein
MKAVSAILVIALFAFPLAAAAEDGAALYKTNCAMCHKVDGSGNPAMKAPDLRAEAVQKMDVARLAEAIKAQPKHTAKIKAFTQDQLTAVATFVKSLKK